MRTGACLLPVDRRRRCIYHVSSLALLRPRTPARDRIPFFARPSSSSSFSPSEFGYRLLQRPRIEFCHSLFPPTRLSHGLAPPSLPPLFHFILASAISSDEGVNGIIPLTDCPSVPLRGASVAFRTLCCVPFRRRRRRPGALLPFRLPSFVLSENEEPSRRSRFPPIPATSRRGAALRLATSCAA